MLEEIQKTILRWILGIALFSIALWSAKKGYHNLDPTLMFVAVMSFAAGLAAVWESLFAAVTRPLMILIESIIFPGTKFNKPTLNLKLPAYYVKEGRYNDALDEYRKVLKHYPDETKAYDEAIWLYTEIFEETEKALKLFNKAKRRNLVLNDHSRSLMKRGNC